MDHPEVYSDGDNTRLIPVSSISNSVLAIGARHAASEPESYAFALAERFLAATACVLTAEVTLLACRQAACLTPQGLTSASGPTTVAITRV
ncbi:hypothetical protein [Streptomyces sp. NPDC001678]|uniref:hypothetical protein n=1 Tax=Streptomyces sp. NPDC001678 TaxID=3364599 RepID=UPI0036799388